ncbi:hypothetical protein [Clostridium sp.]|uniref:hypothetical protein n=1 Tax=Clostridium sp. TaxID=1506 RepID=UPI00261611D2|nr:hypothetical protein [Clostridium sp.]
MQFLVIVFIIILVLLLISGLYNLSFVIPKKLKEQIENQELNNEELQRSLRKSNDNLNYLINEVRKIKEEKTT